MALLLRGFCFLCSLLLCRWGVADNIYPSAKSLFLWDNELSAETSNAAIYLII